MKAYHLSTHDRKTILKDWQSNIAVGIVRAFVDVLISAVQERPLTFIGTPINEKGLENKENILKSLNYISDVTWFHRTIKQTIKNWLIIGTICLRVGYLKTEKKTKITTIINDNAVETVVESNDEDIKDYPYAKSVPIFNIFPDPYGWKLRNVTERWVISHMEFMQTFGSMIQREDNLSPFKNEQFLASLPKNKNGADFIDYWIITTQVHQKVNEECRENDRYALQTWFNRAENAQNQSSTQDEDDDVTKGLIEFKFTTYDDRLVLHANNYPVYISKNNFYGFIPYVIKAGWDEEMRFGEGIPYLMKGTEEIANSFTNNYFDWARSIATPTFVAVKNLLINETQLESWEPWATLWIEAGSSREVISRLDKWGLNDFNIMNIIRDIAMNITGISEYNLWQAAGERTATGALSVTQSSNKRIAPYISTFVDAMSIVAQMWLSLIKKNWTRDRFIYILDEQWNQTFEEINNSKILGWINISLHAEWLFGSTNEIELNKMIQIYQTLAPSGFFSSPKFATEIMKKNGFTANRFIEETEQMKPDWIWTVNTEMWESDMLKTLSSPQLNLWNEWEWQQ